MAPAFFLAADADFAARIAAHRPLAASAIAFRPAALRRRFFGAGVAAGAAEVLLPRSDRASLATFAPANKMEAFFRNNAKRNENGKYLNDAEVYRAYDLELLGPPLSVG